MLAHQHQAPILPVCMTTKTGVAAKPFHKTIISYGELIQPDELGHCGRYRLRIQKRSRMVMQRIQKCGA